jgi:hypothetical protein
VDIPLVQGVFSRAPRLLGGRLAVRRETADKSVEPMMCTCAENHPGRPEDVVGCGAYWTLTLSRGDG